MDGYTFEVGQFAHLSFYGADALRPDAFTRAALAAGALVTKGEMPLTVALDDFRERVCAADLPDPGEIEALYALCRAAAYFVRVKEIESGTDYFTSRYALEVHTFCAFLASADHESMRYALARGFSSLRGAPGEVAFVNRLGRLADQVKHAVSLVFRKQRLNYEGGGR